VDTGAVGSRMKNIACLAYRKVALAKNWKKRKKSARMAKVPCLKESTLIRIAASASLVDLEQNLPFK
jgi:hypothetical protein